MRIKFSSLSMATWLFATGACSHVEEHLLAPPPQAPVATVHCLGRDDADYYFAPGQIVASRDDAYFRRDWFRSYLKAADADSLSCGKPDEAYRLLFMPSSRNARIITVAFRKPDWILETADFGDALFGGVGSIKPPILKRSKRVLSPAEFEQLHGDLMTLDFWHVRQYLNGGADDGWALALEGRSGEKYRVVTRINVDDAYAVFACTLFDLAKLPPLSEGVSFDCPKRMQKVPVP